MQGTRHLQATHQQLDFRRARGLECWMAGDTQGGFNVQGVVSPRDLFKCPYYNFGSVTEFLNNALRAIYISRQFVNSADVEIW